MLVEALSLCVDFAYSVGPQSRKHTMMLATSMFPFLSRQLLLTQVLIRAEKTGADWRASAEGAYARSLSKGSELTGDVKTKMDKEYMEARARQAKAKGDKGVAEGGLPCSRMSVFRA